MFSIIANLQSQTKIKKSKFLGFSFFVNSVEQVTEIVDNLREQYSDASRIVYAWRLKEIGQIKEKFHNDKEPSGSAGQALLYLLQKKDTINCLLIVVRYFGGTKLGVGGLLRAYTEAGQRVLADNLKEWTDGK